MELLENHREGDSSVPQRGQPIRPVERFVLATKQARQNLPPQAEHWSEPAITRRPQFLQVSPSFGGSSSRSAINPPFWFENYFLY